MPWCTSLVPHLTGPPSNWSPSQLYVTTSCYFIQNIHPLNLMGLVVLNPWTHWGRATHICVSNSTLIASDNGLSPGRCQAIIWTSAGILSIGPLAINCSEILIKIQIFSYTKMYLKLSSAKWRLLRLGLNVLLFEDVKYLFTFEDAEYVFITCFYSTTPPYTAAENIYLPHKLRYSMDQIFCTNVLKWPLTFSLPSRCIHLL